MHRGDPIGTDLPIQMGAPGAETSGGGGNMPTNGASGPDSLSLEGVPMRKALTALAIAAAVCVLAGPALAQEYPPQGENLTVNDSRVVVGQTLTISGDGAKPGAEVNIIFASTPRVVATTTANGSGAFSATFRVPSDAEAGTHTISAVSNGTVLSSITIVVAGASSDDDGLPFTGSNTIPGIGIGIALIGLGTVVLMASRRRRSQREHEPVS
jgi:PGF-CTERM protein